MKEFLYEQQWVERFTRSAQDWTAKKARNVSRLNIIVANVKQLNHNQSATSVAENNGRWIILTQALPSLTGPQVWWACWSSFTWRRRTERDEVRADVTASKEPVRQDGGA